MARSDGTVESHEWNVYSALRDLVTSEPGVLQAWINSGQLESGRDGKRLKD